MDGVLCDVCAQYHDTERDTAKALRVAAIFGVIVYSLLPLGAVGTFGAQNITLDNYLGSFYADMFHDILGTGTGWRSSCSVQGSCSQ